MLRLPWLFWLAALPVAAADPFAELVRTTEPRDAAAQQAGFRVPPGFEVQLVAAEPTLRKPMNMAFDAGGRLWVTESREYPYAAPVDKPGRDTITILSDFGPDGRARRTEVFADCLNIPIGVYPYRSGSPATWKCIVWSIPNIWRMEDTDGDGRADKREVLYGPLGYQKDVHGNLASFRRNFDGWLHGTHGFNNESTFRGTDGSELQIQSGNTWRGRIDGSRVEGYTWGQVNPFGLGFDPRGFLYSADCHSSPIYQLIPGGRYPSFGKPDDGLGHAPDCIKHAHGSTGIAGLVYIDDPAWPPEYQHNILIGNVVTSRLNRDHIEFHGSSPKGKEQPDFLTTDDPWFRPVDLQWGPDGALYIADFYNRIIGHYEVPLEHPGRDRERGRIWRVVWRGADGTAPVPEMRPLPADASGLVAEMGSGNPTRRLLALHAFCDLAPSGGREALSAVVPVNDAHEATVNWARWRTGGLDEAGLIRAMRGSNPLALAHALRMAAETPDWSEALAAQARANLRSPDPCAGRLAAAALARHPSAASLPLLLDRLGEVPAADDHFRYQLRRAARDHLAVEALLQGLDPSSVKAEQVSLVLGLLRAVPTPAAADWRLRALLTRDVDAAEVGRQIPDLAAALPEGRVDELATLLEKRLPDDGARAAALEALVPVLNRRNLKPGPGLTGWINRITLRALREDGSPGWQDVPLVHGTAHKPVWGFQTRPATDGRTLNVISSIVFGERNTGILRSAPFTAPATLSFWVSGHDGFPGQPAKQLNRVVLRDAASREVLREARPPRNDTAHKVEWTFPAEAGRKVMLEVEDGDTAEAYAWLAIGDIQPALPELALEEPGKRSERLQDACRMAADLGEKSLLPAIRALVESGRETPALREVAAQAWAKLDADSAAPGLAALLPGADAGVKLGLINALASTRRAAAATALVAELPSAARREQLRLANLLAVWPDGAAALDDALSEGTVPLDLLRDRSLAAKLRASRRPGLPERLTAWIEALPADDAQVARRIEERARKFKPAEADARRGAEVFARNCAVCHSLAGRGALVGPQLDGIGARGLDRILEDILDPNRNIDRAFRLTLVTRKDGSVIGGLLRREDEKSVTLADVTGAEISVPKAEIRDRQESNTSLMPPAFAEAIPEGELNDLLAYLLEARR